MNKILMFREKAFHDESLFLMEGFYSKLWPVLLIVGKILHLQTFFILFLGRPFVVWSSLNTERFLCIILNVFKSFSFLFFTLGARSFFCFLTLLSWIPVMLIPSLSETLIAAKLAVNELQAMIVQNANSAATVRPPKVVGPTSSDAF